jgi:hypothetical protein
MSSFWGYAGADELAIWVIAGLSLASLVCARLFVRGRSPTSRR